MAASSYMSLRLKATARHITMMPPGSNDSQVPVVGRISCKPNRIRMALKPQQLAAIKPKAIPSMGKPSHSSAGPRFQRRPPALSGRRSIPV